MLNIEKHTMAYIRVSLIILILFIPGITFALRCGSDLVLKEDRKIEVLKKCGEPDITEKWEEETVTYVTDEKNEFHGDLIIGGETTIGRSETANVEEWSYNFGPRSFIQYLIFVNGKVKEIEDGPKGSDGKILSGNSKSKCGHLIGKGDRKIEVLINCGDPYLIEHSREEHLSAVSNAIRTRINPQFSREGSKDNKFIRERIYEQKRKSINIEEWTYNFGPSQFMIYIKYENGKVTKVEDIGYGF